MRVLKPVPGRIQRRFDKLSGMQNLNPRQQQRLDAITQKYGSQLNPGPATKIPTKIGPNGTPVYGGPTEGPLAGIPGFQQPGQNVSRAGTPGYTPIEGNGTGAPTPEMMGQLQSYMNGAPAPTVGMKKGGRVKSSAKPAKATASSSKKSESVRGWGKARGARAAKIY